MDPLFAERFPTDDELADMARQTRADFRVGDVVIKPDSWGRALFVVDHTHVNHDGTIGGRIAVQNAAGRIIADRSDPTISGSVRPDQLALVCGNCLQIDLHRTHESGCPTGEAETGTDDDFNLNQIVNVARTLGVDCEVVPGGGNVAFIEARGWERQVHVGGGGYWRAPGLGYAHRADFEVQLYNGTKDLHYDDTTFTPPAGATEADVAAMIANLLADRAPLSDDGRVKPPPLRWTHQHDYDHDDQVAESNMVPPSCTSARYLVGPDPTGWSVLLITSGAGRSGNAGHMPFGNYPNQREAMAAAQRYEDICHQYENR